MYMYYTLNEIHSVFTNDTKTQNRCTALVVLSILRTNRATTNNTEGGGIIETNRMDTELKDSYSPTSDYKFNTSTMFFHNPAFTFHHITRENIRPLHAGQTEHRRRPSLYDKKVAFRAKDSRRSKKRLASAIVVRFSAGLTFERSSSSLLSQKVLRNAVTTSPTYKQKLQIPQVLVKRNARRVSICVERWEVKTLPNSTFIKHTQPTAGGRIFRVPII